MTLEELEIIVKANVEQATKGLEDLKAQMKDIENDEGMQDNFDKISKASEDTGDSVKKASKDFSTMESIGNGALESILKKLKFTKAESGEVATALAQMGTALGSVLAIVGAIAIAVVLLVVRIKMLIAEYKLIWKVLIAFLTPAIKIFIGMLKQVAKVIRDQVSQAYSTLKQKMSDGINNLVQVNGKLNDSLSSLKSSLTQTGNALATAVAPIIQTVIPIMNNLLAVITNVANGIAQVTASLFGNATTFKKATKVNEDYAKSVGSINKQLAKFDELNVINDNGNASPYDMFTDEKIDEDILDLTTKLKELWNTDDLEGLEDFGKEIGKKVKEQISQINAEEWGNDLGSKVNKAITLANGFLEEQPFRDFGGNVADLILGFLDDEKGLNSKNVGRLIGNIINNAVGMIKDFLDEMDAKDGWRQIGEWLANALNSAINTMEADEIGEAINSFVNGVLDLAITFFDTADWDMYFDKINEILQKQDWTKIISKVLYLLWEAWNKTEHIRQMIIWSIVSDVYKSLHESSNPFVQLIFGRVFWIVDTIVGTIKGIKASVESVILDIEQVFKGLTDFLDGVFTGDWAKAWGGIQTIMDGVFWGMYDTAIGVVNGIITAINEGFNTIERVANSLIAEFNSLPFVDDRIDYLDIPDIPPLKTRLQMLNEDNAKNNLASGSVSAHKMNQGAKHVRLAKGGVLDRPTLALMGEYAGASSNPEIVAPQSMLLETSERANIPVMNSIEEMGDKLVTALNSIGVYAEFDYSKLKVGLDNENYRVGGKLYGI